MLSTGYDQRCIATASEYGGTTDAMPLITSSLVLILRPYKDDRLSQPHLRLIQRLTGLELRTLRSQAYHRNHEANTRLFSHHLKSEC